MASNNEVIIEEIEALQAIMMDEVTVHFNESGQPNAVEITVKPATAQNIEEQHVIVTLIVSLPSNYPDEPPTISLRNPRGIDDDVLQLIKRESIQKCEEYLGLPVIYELTELVREKLTANNTPSCPCAICLFHFTDNDHFTKTPCFHYFHSNCLGRYIMNCEETAAAEEKENQQPVWMTREKRQLLCPVCRESLNKEISGTNLLGNPPPEEGEKMKDFNPSCPEIKFLQDKLTSLYLHQKSKGGIIDLEEEKNKFLISAAVNNLEQSSSERDSLAEEKLESSELGSSRGDPAPKQVSNKSGAPPPSQNPPKRCGGGRGGGHNQGKREHSSTNVWYGGNKSHNNRRGNKANANRQNFTAVDNRCADPASQPCEEKFSHRRPPRHNDRHRHQHARHQDPTSLQDAKAPTTVDNRPDEPKKNNRPQFYRNSHHRGRGSSRGGAPPGFSELEKNVRSPATS